MSSRDMGVFFLVFWNAHQLGPRAKRSTFFAFVGVVGGVGIRCAEMRDVFIVVGHGKASSRAWWREIWGGAVAIAIAIDK